MDRKTQGQHSSNPQPVPLWPFLKPRKKSGPPDPTSLTSSKLSAFTVPLPLPALQNEHLLHAGLWARVVQMWLPAHLLVGNMERRIPLLSRWGH